MAAMSETERDPVSPAVEARFRALAAAVSDDDWGRLVKGTADVALRKLGACGALDEASPEALAQAHQLLGQLLVDYTNVALTCVAQGLEAEAT